MAKNGIILHAKFIQVAAETGIMARPGALQIIRRNPYNINDTHSHLEALVPTRRSFVEYDRGIAARVVSGSFIFRRLSVDSPMSHTLWSLKAGEKGCIAGYDEALAKSYRVRLMELGFHPGEMVSCLQAPRFGAPKVYRVANTIFSIDDEVGSHVSIIPVPDNE